jgi:threonine dehydrogenase-like Zn-dependent dehydrogenase
MFSSGSSATAMMLVGPRTFCKNTLAIPEITEGGWLAIEATGISGVDVQAWKGVSRLAKYPLIPGHEVVGRIASDPFGTLGFPVGTRVIVESNIRCGKCSRCRNGLSTCSAKRPTNAYGQIPSSETPSLWGGLAEALYLDPGATLHKISDDLPAAVSTFAHPLASGWTWAVEVPKLRPGQSVLVLGPGPRGLACLAAARSAGAGWVGITGLSHDADRLALAEKLGADTTIDIEVEDPASAVADSLGTRPDVIIDVTGGDTEAFLTALDLVRPGGTVVLASTKGNSAVQNLFSDIILMKEITIKGSFGATSAGYHWATRHLSSEPMFDDVVSHEFPLDEAQRAIQATAGMLGHDQLFSVAVTF